MVSIFIFGMILMVALLVLFNMDSDVIIAIHSRYGMGLKDSNVSTSYVAKKKKGRKGKDSSDWDYYDDSGEKVEKKELIELIFSVFAHEDWYGEYNYYVNDEPLYSDTTSVDAINHEQEVMDSIEEEKEITETA